MEVYFIYGCYDQSFELDSINQEYRKMKFNLYNYKVFIILL